jgi:hypothetical protein
MRNRLASRLRSKPFSSAVLVLCGLAAFWLAMSQAALWSEWTRFAISAWTGTAVGNVEAARPSALSEAIAHTAGTPVRAVMPYHYRGHSYSVRVSIPAAELTLARSLPTELVFASHGAARAAYLRTMVGAAQTDPVVSATCGQLRATRDALGLDADEYAELLVRFVQQIPYGPVRPRFGPPAVVMAEGRAVCADKSVLLAALLVHEGYSAAVVSIDSNHHAAVAIRGMSSGYLRSGYTYVETTVDAYIGEVPAQGAGTGPAGARTQVVAVGGSRRYTAELESQFLGETLIRARREVRILAPYRAAAAKATGDSKRVFAAMAERHFEAVRLASTLPVTTDERARTYELLTRSGGR